MLNVVMLSVVILSVMTLTASLTALGPLDFKTKKGGQALFVTVHFKEPRYVSLLLLPLAFSSMAFRRCKCGLTAAVLKATCLNHSSDILSNF